MTDLDPRLTDENAQKVLARALELQAQSAGALTVAQIREIASELCIPESAVDQALSEYRTAGAAELSPRAAAAAAPTSTKKVDWRIVGIALMPALGLSIVITLLGGMLGLSESAADRVSQIVFFPTFLGAYHYAKRRRSVTPA